MKNATYMDRVLCRENPQLLSSEWTALDAFCDLSINLKYAELESAQRNPRTSGPLIRAMRIIIEHEDALNHPNA